jgi:hypothetical protein
MNKLFRIVQLIAVIKPAHISGINHGGMSATMI